MTCNLHTKTPDGGGRGFFLTQIKAVGVRAEYYQRECVLGRASKVLGIASCIPFTAELHNETQHHHSFSQEVRYLVPPNLV